MMIMKRISLALVLAAVAGSAFAQTNVGVSVQVAQPGLYGRIDIGQVAAPPAVVYAQPVIVAPPPRTVVVEQQPIYLRVPPGHAKHWAKHCREYNACGQRVYFVREDWYQQQYMPAVQGHGHGDDDHPGKGHGKGHGKGKGHD
jgi:hypothetical protein